MTTEQKRHRILITGSRAWPDPVEVESQIALYLLETGDIPYTLVHGGAHGADMFSAYAALVLSNAGWDIEIEEHEADWSQGKAAGVLRNQAMVDMGADVVLAFNHNNSRGTAHCMSAAIKAGIPVREYTS